MPEKPSQSIVVGAEKDSQPYKWAVVLLFVAFTSHLMLQVGNVVGIVPALIDTYPFKPTLALFLHNLTVVVQSNGK